MFCSTNRRDTSCFQPGRLDRGASGLRILINDTAFANQPQARIRMFHKTCLVKASMLLWTTNGSHADSRFDCLRIFRNHQVTGTAVRPGVL